MKTMDIKNIAVELNCLSEALDYGDFDDAESGIEILYQKVVSQHKKDGIFFE